MIAEAIERVEELAREALTPQFVHLPGDPAHVIHIAMPGGELVRQEVTPGNRMVKLALIDDLIALGKAHFDAGTQAAQRMVVMYNATEVVLVFDHTTGREKAYVELRTTEEWGFFADRRAKPVISPKDLRDALRYFLRKTYGNAHLIDQVSKLEFKDVDTGSVNVQRGRESMGRSIDAQVQEPDDLPDPYQTFSVRKYQNPDLDVRRPILCALDPDTKTRQWILKPLEDSWLEFEDAQLQIVGNRLREAFKDTAVRVFQGVFSQDQPKVPS